MVGLGCCLICYKPSSSSSSSCFEGVRVVHLSGFVEDLEDPITVSELTGKPPKYFVCTSAQLLSFKSTSKTLPPETQLQRGQVYFLLPFSVFDSETSPASLIHLSNRLSAVAKRFGSSNASALEPSPSKRSSKNNSTTVRVNSLFSNRRSKSSTEGRINPFYSPSRLERSNASTPDRVMSPISSEHVIRSTSTTAAQNEEDESDLDHQLYGGDDEEVFYRSKSWKPILETIIEKSGEFIRPSSSDTIIEKSGEIIRPSLCETSATALNLLNSSFDFKV